MDYPPTIQKLIKLFSKFPTIGPKTAARFVFYLLGTKDENINELIDNISKLKKTVKTCSLCQNSFEDPAGICKICSSAVRDKSLLCIIAKETDLIAIEKTRMYKGLYFILGGVISSLMEKDIEKIKSKELRKRIEKNPEIKEIIIATNSNSKGETTALYLRRLLKPFNKKITRLGRGLPVGGELEYADIDTLKSALEGRK